MSLRIINFLSVGLHAAQESVLKDVKTKVVISQNCDGGTKTEFQVRHSTLRDKGNYMSSHQTKKCC